MSEQEFEKVYQRFYFDFYEKIYKNLPQRMCIYPSDKEQQKIIDSSLNTKNCTYRFIDEIANDSIRPLGENDHLFPFDKAKFFSNRDFFRLIEPTYIIPYLVYGGLAYELSAKLNVNRDFLLQVEYKIDLPIDFSGAQKNFFWYTQISRILSLNENNQIISHINIYQENAQFKVVDGRPQNRFVEATIFVNNEFHNTFQLEFEKKFSSFLYENVFTPTELRVLNKKITGKEAYDHHKHIANKITKYTGDHFINIRYIRSYLKSIGFFDIAA